MRMIYAEMISLQDYSYEIPLLLPKSGSHHCQGGCHFTGEGRLDSHNTQPWAQHHVPGAQEPMFPTQLPMWWSWAIPLLTEPPGWP